MDIFQGILPCHSFSNTITAIWSGNVNWSELYYTLFTPSNLFRNENINLGWASGINYDLFVLNQQIQKRAVENQLKKDLS